MTADWMVDPSRLEEELDCRSISFENPTGGRGAGGRSARGRKGSPYRDVGPGETVTIADLTGPGTIRHLWMTVGPGPPEHLRSIVLEVFYDDLDQPSVSVPMPDFFGCPHGRLVPYHSAVHAVQEGKGLNSYLPLPFAGRIRVTVRNASQRSVPLFYQADYTLEARVDLSTQGFLHASFRRENPTTIGRDFEIASGLRGPGRFLGSVVGIRVLDDGHWYGEGEVKVYRDGDRDLPTLCGTGLEDYVGSAYGLGPHAAPFGGAPLVLAPPDPASGRLDDHAADFVGFYRWHLLDPIMFREELRVTIQQIGNAVFRPGQEAEYERFARSVSPAGTGWIERRVDGVLAEGLYERIDDYCATAFVYVSAPQGVPRVDVAAATADIARRPYEQPHPAEAFM